MSLGTVNVFCQIGFAQKKGGDTYFHTVDGKPYGGTLVINDATDYLNPFTVDDLLGGVIPFDLLPGELQDTILDFAQRTIRAIEREDTRRVQELKQDEVEVSFRLYDDEGIGEYDGGEGGHPGMFS